MRTSRSNNLTSTVLSCVQRWLVIAQTPCLLTFVVKVDSQMEESSTLASSRFTRAESRCSDRHFGDFVTNSRTRPRYEHRKNAIAHAARVPTNVEIVIAQFTRPLRRTASLIQHALTPQMARQTNRAPILSVKSRISVCRSKANRNSSEICDSRAIRWPAALWRVGR